MQNTRERPGRTDSAPYAIESVINASRILLMLRSAKELQVARVADELGVARSTAHRLLTTLQSQGLLQQAGARRAYSPGPALVEIGAAVVGALDLRGMARPLLERVSRETGETTHLIVLRDTEIIFVDGVDGRHSVRAATKIGAHGPAHATAAGKVLLSMLPDGEVARRYPKPRLGGGTEHAAATRAALEKELAITAERGYGLNISESESDLCAIAVAFRDQLGSPLGAISISGPESRMRPRIEEFARLLTSAVVKAPDAK